MFVRKIPSSGPFLLYVSCEDLDVLDHVLMVTILQKQDPFIGSLPVMKLKDYEGRSYKTMLNMDNLDIQEENVWKFLLFLDCNSQSPSARVVFLNKWAAVNDSLFYI